MDFCERIEQQEKHIEVVLQCAEYCIDYKWSIREIADNMLLSKTTVHRYLTEDLKDVDYEKYECARRILRERRI